MTIFTVAPTAGTIGRHWLFAGMLENDDAPGDDASVLSAERRDEEPHEPRVQCSLAARPEAAVEDL